uniref:Ribosomal protein L22 n=1 Tax=Romanomermis culicivorax TaxID=13658 RepID=A0A915HW41_ROMCU
MSEVKKHKSWRVDAVKRMRITRILTTSAIREDHKISNRTMYNILKFKIKLNKFYYCARTCARSL